jgi:hypothetical protein
MADEFCEKCLAESADESAGNIVEGMFGREFMGQARRCGECSSYVTTLWSLLFYFPVTPIGSYRYKHGKIGFGKVTFFSRKVPLDEEQVKSTRLRGTLTALLVLVAAGVALYIKYR